MNKRIKILLCGFTTVPLLALVSFQIFHCSTIASLEGNGWTLDRWEGPAISLRNGYSDWAKKDLPYSPGMSRLVLGSIPKAVYSKSEKKVSTKETARNANRIGRIRGLETLVIKQLKHGTIFFENLPEMKNLEWLTLDEVELNDSAWGKIGDQHSIKSLWMRDIELTAQAWKNIGRLENLELLIFVNVTGEYSKLPRLNKLKIFQAHYCELKESDMRRLSSFSSLTVLVIATKTPISEATIKTLSALPKLEGFSVVYDNIHEGQSLPEEFVKFINRKYPKLDFSVVRRNY